jgi:hypothetical protein
MSVLPARQSPALLSSSSSSANVNIASRSPDNAAFTSAINTSVVIEKPLSGVDALRSAAIAARSRIWAAPSSPGPPPPPRDSSKVSSSRSKLLIPVNTSSAGSSGVKPVAIQLSSWFFQKPGVHDDAGGGTEDEDDDGGSSADTGETMAVAATTPTATAAAAPTMRAVLTVLMVPPGLRGERRPDR